MLDTGFGLGKISVLHNESPSLRPRAWKYTKPEKQDFLVLMRKFLIPTLLSKIGKYLQLGSTMSIQTLDCNF